MNRYFVAILASILHTSSFCQDLFTPSVPNRYATPQNPLYWKNRPPFPGYWQQDVHYIISAYIDENTDIIHGKEKLIYTNNSPDTLTYVFFHLYQNAFQPESYYDDLNRRNNLKPRYGRYEREKKGTEIRIIKVNGSEVSTELDNTILKVILPKPLPPHQQIEFYIEFNTYFDAGGNIRRRMKLFNDYGFKHYDGVHWYPRISVYDRKFGWTTDQHLGHEFYGDYGTYDVQLNFPSNFIVEATGELLNEKEVMPDSLRKKLDLSNFKDKWGGAPSIIIPYRENERKIWIYHAENVHDFAFTADPTYRIGEVRWNNIRIIALAQEPHAAGWQNAALFTARVIKTYSEDIGMYVYPKIVAADAKDGMEYPMITLDGGFNPNYRGLIAHEVGHNWFFGMIGNNETYRACLDEGFTQFLTAWALKKIDGDTIRAIPDKSAYKRKFREPESPVYNEVMMGYLLDASVEEDMPLNTHSDDFNGAIRHGGGYRHVYYKTATMLYNLRYVLGDSLFLKAMQHYFNQWKICHPYPEDFRNSIIQFTKMDLNWFFDQWMETTKNIDYKVGRIKKGKFEDDYIIRFKRKGAMQMPLDFTVISYNDKKYHFQIPNTWFVKPTTATILPRWIGWHKNLKPVYDAKVHIPGGIKDVIIDTTYQLADINLLDNRKKFPVRVQFDHQLYNYPVWKEYRVYVRPDLWYNCYDGIKTGIHVNGNYFERFHQFHLTFWINTGIAQYGIQQDATAYDPFSYSFSYKTSTHKLLKNSSVEWQSRWLDGLELYKASFQFYNRSKKDLFFIYHKSMLRKSVYYTHYLIYPEEWSLNKYNNSLHIGVTHYYQHFHGKGEITLTLRTPSLMSDNNFSALSLLALHSLYIHKSILRTRFFAQYGSGNAPHESALYLAGASPEEMMENKFFRANTFLPPAWSSYNSTTGHIQMGGGLNIRGYNTYLAIENTYDSVYHAYKAQSGISLTAEWEFDQYLGWKPKNLSKLFNVDMYIFGDCGYLDYQRQIENIFNTLPRTDAGIGFTFEIKRWPLVEKPDPLVIRFDMPLFLNRPPAGEEYLQFRWLISIHKSF